MENAMLIMSGNRKACSNEYNIIKTLQVEEVENCLKDFQTVIEFIQLGIDNKVTNIVLLLGNKTYDYVLQVLYKGGLYGLVKVWILPEYNFEIKELNIENHFIEIKDYNKPRLESFQVHLTDVCNLNCKGCGHFSNIAKEKIFWM